MEDHNEYSGRIITNAVVFAILFCAKIKRSGEKTSEARATFKRVVDEFPDSMYANDAKTEMGS
jgi:outer membrane protein assembly factor BamD (BamD/ComL family)